MELGLGHADPVPSLGASPKGKMVRWIPEGVYSVGLLGAKTEIPAKGVYSVRLLEAKTEIPGYGTVAPAGSPIDRTNA